MSVLKYLIECVEDNNRCNDAEWSDWKDGQHIIDTYYEEWDGDADSTADEAVDILDNAIASEGESLKKDLRAFEKKICGQNFAGSFYDRP